MEEIGSQRSAISDEVIHPHGRECYRWERCAPNRVFSGRNGVPLPLSCLENNIAAFACPLLPRKHSVWRFVRLSSVGLDSRPRRFWQMALSIYDSIPCSADERASFAATGFSEILSH